MAEEKKYTKEDIQSIECKFIFHLDEIEDVRPDTHISKEIITYKDGVRKPNLRIIKNYERPFYITKPHFQKHKQKKEAESLDRVSKYTCTQSNLAKSIASRLGGRYVGCNNLRTVRDSPYVYGIDVDAKTHLKKMYMDKYPDAVSPFQVCVLDIEEDMDREEVIVAAISMKGKTYTTILKRFVDGQHDIDKRLRYLYDKYVPKSEWTEGVSLEYEVCETEIEMVQKVMKKAHEWKPDFMEVWNIGYDVPRMVKVCEQNDVDPKDVFCEPSLPEELKYFKYKEGMKQKLTESGKYTPINIEEQWHSVIAPAYFWWIDGMSAHRYIRAGGKVMPGGYSLDNVLENEVGKKFKKLKMTDEKSEHLIGLDWHKYMVANDPLGYVIYNNYDTIAPLVMDAKTKDLSHTLSMLAGVSSFEIFNSGPKKIIDAMHFFYLENNMVLGAKPSRADSDKLLGLDDWIVLLNADRIKDNGMRIIEEDSTLNTNIRTHTFDADQVSGYPSDGQAANVSKDTTMKEILEIKGIDKELFKKQNINLLFGPVNALEYGNEMFGLPTLFELSKWISEELKKDKEKMNVGAED